MKPAIALALLLGCALSLYLGYLGGVKYTLDKFRPGECPIGAMYITPDHQILECTMVNNWTPAPSGSGTVTKIESDSSAGPVTFHDNLILKGKKP